MLIHYITYGSVRYVSIKNTFMPLLFAQNIVTEKVRVLKITRDRWRKLARRSGDPAALSAYRNYIREVKRELRLAQRSCFEQKENFNNSSSMWKIICTCIPIKSSGNNCLDGNKSAANNDNVTKIKSLTK